jgi:hypothetical protein
LSCVVTFQKPVNRLDASSPGMKLSQRRILVLAHASNVDNLPDQEAIVVSNCVEFEHIVLWAALVSTSPVRRRLVTIVAKESEANAGVDHIRPGGRIRGRNADQIVCFYGK